MESASGAASRASGFGFMNAASYVVSYVRDDVDDIVKTFRSTNWTDELATFGKELKEETIDAMKTIEELPQKATQAIPGMTSMSHNLSAGVHQLVSSTKGIFDQAANMVESELQSTSRLLWTGQSEQSHASSSVKFTRLQTEVLEMQRDSGTYCEEPDDQEDFRVWKQTFSVEESVQEIESLTEKNTFMAELHKRIVPLVVEHEVFWTRYFYRLHKLRQTHEQRQQLAEKTLRMHQEQTEEQKLQWDDGENEETLTAQEQLPLATNTQSSGSERRTEVREDDVQSTEMKPVTKEQEDSDWTLVESEREKSVREQPPEVKNVSLEESNDGPPRTGDDEEIDEDWGNWD